MIRAIYLALATMATILIFIFTYFLMPINVKHNYKLPSYKSSDIVKYLEDKGIFTSKLDSLFLKFTNPKKGWVYVNKKSMPRFRFLIELSSIKNRYRVLKIIPGETNYFVLKNMANNLKYDQKKLINAYNSLKIYKDGNFLADTYHIPTRLNERKVINYLVEHTFKKYKKIAKDNSVDFKNFKKYIIIASILEKEAASKKEMKLISSVIYNRLDKNMRLQVDGSLNYGKFSHTKVTHDRIKLDKSSYNTYKHRGLPNEPICNVSKDSIMAALKPAKSEYLYFMKKDSRSHRFSKTFNEHKENIKKRK